MVALHSTGKGFILILSPCGCTAQHRQRWGKTDRVLWHIDRASRQGMGFYFIFFVVLFSNRRTECELWRRTRGCCPHAAHPSCGDKAIPVYQLQLSEYTRQTMPLKHNQCNGVVAPCAGCIIPPAVWYTGGLYSLRCGTQGGYTACSVVHVHRECKGCVWLAD